MKAEHCTQQSTETRCLNCVAFSRRQTNLFSVYLNSISWPLAAHGMFSNVTNFARFPTSDHERNQIKNVNFCICGELNYLKFPELSEGFFDCFNSRLQSLWLFTDRVAVLYWSLRVISQGLTDILDCHTLAHCLCLLDCNISTGL